MRPETVPHTAKRTPPACPRLGRHQTNPNSGYTGRSARDHWPITSHRGLVEGLHEEILVMDVLAKPWQPMKSSGTVSVRRDALRPLTNHIHIEAGSISFSAAANRQPTGAGRTEAPFQSQSAGGLYVRRTRLLAGLRTSHRQLYVS